MREEQPPVSGADRLDPQPGERRRRARGDRDGDGVSASVEDERQHQRAAGHGAEPSYERADAVQLAPRVRHGVGQARRERFEAGACRPRRTAELGRDAERELLVARIGAVGQHRERGHRRA